MKVKLIFLSILIGVFSILSVSVIFSKPCLTPSPYTASINDYNQQDCSILGNYYCKNTIIINGRCDNPLIVKNNSCELVSHSDTFYIRFCTPETDYKCVSIPYSGSYLNGELIGDCGE